MAKAGHRRVYHHYRQCEEFDAGMWSNIPTIEKEPAIARAAGLMRDTDGFRAAMVRAVHEWPMSCEMNLTAPSINRQAWIGHAGCCIVARTPEAVTRLAWHTLNQAEQDAANAAADDALAVFDRAYREKQESEKCQNVQLALTF